MRPTAAPSVRTHHPAGRSVASLSLVLGSQFSVQFGAAIADSLFSRIGVFGTVSLRVGVAGVLLLAICRPRLTGRSRTDWAVICGFGFALAAMNTLLYSSLERIPLGAAVTIEVLGPLVLSVALAQRAIGWLWAALALAGVVVLGRGGFVGGLSSAGVLCAIGAACMWAGYILLAQRAGSRFTGLDGLALAMSVAALLTIPTGVLTSGATLARPDVFGLGCAVALLSSLLPYAADLLALRRMPSGSFALLMSLSPAVAATAGAVVLGQRITWLAALAIGMVVAANAASVLTARSVQQPLRRGQDQAPTPQVDGGHDVAHERH